MPPLAHGHTWKPIQNTSVHICPNSAKCIFRQLRTELLGSIENESRSKDRTEGSGPCACAYAPNSPGVLQATVHCTLLQNPFLSGNSLSHEGAKMLAASLMTNTALQNLYLHCVPCAVPDLWSEKILMEPPVPPRRAAQLGRHLSRRAPRVQPTHGLDWGGVSKVGGRVGAAGSPWLPEMTMDILGGFGSGRKCPPPPQFTK